MANGRQFVKIDSENLRVLQNIVRFWVIPMELKFKSKIILSKRMLANVKTEEIFIFVAILKVCKG